MDRPSHSLLMRLVALLAIVILLPWHGLLRAAVSSEELCERHGRSCECTEMCKREKEEHHPKPAAPSCHRDTEQPTAEASTETKSGCRMTSCGPAAPDGLESSHHPSTSALVQHAPASLVAADRLQPSSQVVTPLLFASPPHPPPQV